MADESLILLATEVRGKTLRMLDGVSDEDARFAPTGLSNTILWHAGHVLVVVERLSVAPATGRAPAYPAGWFEMFGWKSVPAAVTHWPALGEVVERLRDQVGRLTTAIGALSPGQLAATGDHGRTLRYEILHGLHDEACHQGEIHLLRKMRRAGHR